MEYELVFLGHVILHNVFHASLLKKYFYDTKHVVDFSILQVEPEAEFSPGPIHILDKRDT